jgi:hypothetical protein
VATLRDASAAFHGRGNEEADQCDAQNQACLFSLSTSVCIAVGSPVGLGVEETLRLVLGDARCLTPGSHDRGLVRCHCLLVVCMALVWVGGWPALTGKHIWHGIVSHRERPFAHRDIRLGTSPNKPPRNDTQQLYPGQTHRWRSGAEARPEVTTGGIMDPNELEANQGGRTGSSAD